MVENFAKEMKKCFVQAFKDTDEQLLNKASKELVLKLFCCFIEVLCFMSVLKNIGETVIITSLRFAL